MIFHNVSILPWWIITVVSCSFCICNEQTNIVPPTLGAKVGLDSSRVVKWCVAHLEGIGVHSTNHPPSRSILFHIMLANMHLGRICPANVQLRHHGWWFWMYVEDTRCRISWVFCLQHPLWVHYLQWWTWLWIARTSYRLFWSVCATILLSIGGGIQVVSQAYDNN